MRGARDSWSQATDIDGLYVSGLEREGVRRLAERPRCVTVYKLG